MFMNDKTVFKLHAAHQIFNASLCRVEIHGKRYFTAAVPKLFLFSPAVNISEFFRGA